jgi:hypothetical protein
MATRKLIVELIGNSASLERAFGRASKSAVVAHGEFSKVERGVLSGSGVFQGLGRSIAFASGGFLAFASASSFLRKSVDAALEAAVAQRQLATQLRNNGDVFAEYRVQIEQTTNRLSALSGFNNDQLITGLTTILRTVPNVAKAMRDLGTAADLARAKHIDLNAAALIIAKTEAGNTTLLRRQGFEIAKHATAEQALAKLRQVVAGQARAGSTEQERFGAILHNTEEIIGTGLLPTINKYLSAGGKWLQQMNESGKLQQDVRKDAHAFATVIGDVADVVKTADHVTGSFKNTLELLIGLRISKWALETFAGLGRIGGAAEGATGKLAGLRAGLVGLAEIAIPVIVIPYEFKFAGSNANPLKRPFEAIGKKLADALTRGPEGGTPPTGNPFLGKVTARLTPDQVDQLRSQHPELTDHDFQILLAAAVNIASAPRAAAGFATDARNRESAADKATKAARSKLTATQRNTFFDNAIARILLRGGLGTLDQQSAALKTAEVKIRGQLATVKDITRHQKLMDDLLSTIAQEKSVQQQIAQAATQARQTTFDNLIGALTFNVTKAQATAAVTDDIAALEALNAGLRREARVMGDTADIQTQLFQNAQTIKQLRGQRQEAQLFAILGLGPTGDAKVPTVHKLTAEVANLTKKIVGTVYDTAANERKLTQLRKLLLDRALPGHPEVKQKAQDIIDTLTSSLSSASQLPRFKHVTATALLSGLGLDPTTMRILHARLAQLGPGGTVPAGASAAFAGAGAGREIVVHNTLTLDGQVVTRTVTRGQQKDATRRTQSRRGPYAGRH